MVRQPNTVQNQLKTNKKTILRSFSYDVRVQGVFLQRRWPYLAVPNPAEAAYDVNMLYDTRAFTARDLLYKI